MARNLTSVLYVKVAALIAACAEGASDAAKQAQVCFLRSPGNDGSILANGFVSFSKDSGKPYRTKSGFIVLNLKADRKLVRQVYLNPAVLGAALHVDAGTEERQAQVGFIRTPGKEGSIEGNCWVSFVKETGKAHSTKEGFYALNVRPADKQQAAARSLEQVAEKLSTADEVEAAMPEGITEQDADDFVASLSTL